MESGAFEWPPHDPEQGRAVLSATDLAMLLGGIDLRSVRRRKRYRKPAALVSSQG